MKRAVLRVAPDLSEDHIDSAAMHAALHRLHHAAEGQIADIASTLSAQERATLAVVCYKRAHLYGIGLALAAQCSLAELTAATGSSTPILDE